MILVTLNSLNGKLKEMEDARSRVRLTVQLLPDKNRALIKTKLSDISDLIWPALNYNFKWTIINKYFATRNVSKFIWFNSIQCLSGICMLSLCLCRFSPGTPVSCHIQRHAQWANQKIYSSGHSSECDCE